jgi:hypothetical protein
MRKVHSDSYCYLLLVTWLDYTLGKARTLRSGDGDDGGDGGCVEVTMVVAVMGGE